MKKENIDRGFLKFTYSWSDESTDDSLENVTIQNGRSVLEFINWFFTSYGLTSRKSCEQIEELLHKMPRHYRSWKDAAKWICRNWTSEPTYTNPTRHSSTKLS